MSILIENEPQAYAIGFTDDSMIVRLKDGRTLDVPLVWYPSLEEATQEQREDYLLIGDGEGIHWPQIDEDLSIKGFLQGIRLDKPHAA